jgi:hypothetical protein
MADVFCLQSGRPSSIIDNVRIHSVSQRRDQKRITGSERKGSGRIVSGQYPGGAELALELTDNVTNGTANPLQLTSTYQVASQGQGNKTAGRIVGGTGLRALIGDSRAGERALQSTPGWRGRRIYRIRSYQGKQVPVPTESTSGKSPTPSSTNEIEASCRIVWMLSRGGARGVTRS